MHSHTPTNYSVGAELNKLPKHEFQRLPQFDLINGNGDTISRFRAEDKTQATQLADEYVRDTAKMRKLNGWEPIRNWKVRAYTNPNKKKAEKWMAELQKELGEKETIRKRLANGDEVLVVRTHREERALV